MKKPELIWLPECPEFSSYLKTVRNSQEQNMWPALVALANCRLDFIQTNALDQVARELFSDNTEIPEVSRTYRLAILGSSTTAHLHAGIRVAGLRRNLRFITYEPAYGQFGQELITDSSALQLFAPDFILFALDARYLAARVTVSSSMADIDGILDTVVQSLIACWRRARQYLHATVLQQVALPIFHDLVGGNEHRVAGSRAWFLVRLNERLRQIADEEKVHLISVDRMAIRYGISNLYDTSCWHHGKQEISPAIAPLYGELVARLIGAHTGRSAKCLVLDLDNTLWGGVVGDDGQSALTLGQGSAEGEAFLDIQKYVMELSDRGVILAVCSKNDATAARSVFEKHPEMFLKLDRIARFVANWNDKATNIRQIAAELNIGLDALVFLDDSPFERNLVRQELPMVAVPELGQDPALIPQLLSDAGYFESIGLTPDDLARTKQYQSDSERHIFQSTLTDMDSYLCGLEMRLKWQRLSLQDVPRIVQLINKTNQFNLTARRTTSEEVLALTRDKHALGFHFRLVDRFGDNGIIAIVVGQIIDQNLYLDTWVMSCRVLGRRVEEATLAVVASAAKQLGIKRLIGEYRPTARNSMVANHYEKLGFTAHESGAEGSVRNILLISNYKQPDVPIVVEQL